jgi:glycine/D-amino acid oxidase-like deaminating enzyme
MPDHVGVFLPEAVVVDSSRYLEGLWKACEALATARAPGSSIRLERQTVRSLHDLQREGRFDAIIVATGAAATAIAEVPDSIRDFFDLSQVAHTCPPFAVQQS